MNSKPSFNKPRLTEHMQYRSQPNYSLSANTEKVVPELVTKNTLKEPALSQPETDYDNKMNIQNEVTLKKIGQADNTTASEQKPLVQAQAIVLTEEVMGKAANVTGTAEKDNHTVKANVNPKDTTHAAEAMPERFEELEREQMIQKENTTKATDEDENHLTDTDNDQETDSPSEATKSLPCTGRKFMWAAIGVAAISCVGYFAFFRK